MSSNRVEQSNFEADATPENLDEDPTTPASSANVAKSSFPFEAMSLKVGDRLQAQPPTKVSAERCFVRLIGYLEDLSMLITTPATVNSVRLQLMEGDQLVMRVFSSQNAFGFASEVQRICKLPYSYLHISFPKKVQGTVIRKAARVKIQQSESSLAHFGLEFVDLQPNDRMLLQSMVYQKMIEQPQSLI